jgi:hypothetical protein
MQISVGNQSKRSRLAALAGGRCAWDQDFAFAIVLPLRTRPLRLELHQSNGRKRGRLLARAYLPLANLFPEGSGEGAPLLPALLGLHACMHQSLRCSHNMHSCIAMHACSPVRGQSTNVATCMPALDEASGPRMHAARRAVKVKNPGVRACCRCLCIAMHACMQPGSQSNVEHPDVHARAVGADGEWFRLHDALRASPMGVLGAGGAFEGAVRLSAACVDCDGRRALYGLPLAVPAEERLTRGGRQGLSSTPPFPRLLSGACTGHAQHPGNAASAWLYSPRSPLSPGAVLVP